MKETEEKTIPSNEQSQKVCIKWWKISQWGFEWIVSTGSAEQTNTNEHECDQEKKTVHLFYYYGAYLFMPHLFLVLHYFSLFFLLLRSQLLFWVVFPLLSPSLTLGLLLLSLISLLFTKIFSCTCNKTNIRKGKTRKYAKKASWIKNRSNSVI